MVEKEDEVVGKKGKVCDPQTAPGTCWAACA